MLCKNYFYDMILTDAQQTYIFVWFRYYNWEIVSVTLVRVTQKKFST